MKKNFFGLVFSVVLFSIVTAQSGTKTLDVKVDGSKFNEANADLSQIDIDFCDTPGEKSIIYSMFPGKTQDICLQATNTSDKDIELTMEFVDGAVTNDQRKNKACMQKGEDKKFGQYVRGFTGTFLVGAHNVAYQHAKFTLPKGSTGIVNGCLVYYTKSVAMGNGLGFSVLMRKAKFIDIQVKQFAIIKNSLLGLLGFLVIVGVSKFIFFSKKPKKTTKK